METHTILSIDPGKSTGIAFGYYGPELPYTLREVIQLEGGIHAFTKWCKHFNWDIVDTVVSEKFILKKTSFIPDTEPLLLEGALLFLHGEDIHWQAPSDKQHVPDQLLKDHGMWQTGSDVGCKDARDANDAIIHALAFLKKSGHVPTLKTFWGNNEQNQ
jgi:hypothetical protein